MQLERNIVPRCHVDRYPDLDFLSNLTENCLFSPMGDGNAGSVCKV